MNIFAYTAPGADFPEFISINEKDGEFVVTARGAGGGPTVDVNLPREQAKELHRQLMRALIPTDKA